MEDISKSAKPSEAEGAPGVEQEHQTQKSAGPTGPRTIAGKELASKNSTKHRICAEKLLPTEAQAADMLEKGLQAEFRARGLMERNVIRRLAQNLIERERIDVWVKQQSRLAQIDHMAKLAEAQPRELERPPVDGEASDGVLSRHLWNSNPTLLSTLKKWLRKGEPGISKSWRRLRRCLTWKSRRCPRH